MQGYWIFVLSENPNCFYLGEWIGEGVESEETGEGEGWIYSRYTQKHPSGIYHYGWWTPRVATYHSFHVS